VVTDSYSILARWRNHFSRLLNIRGVNDVRQTELCTSEPLVPELSAFELEFAIEKLKSSKSPDVDQIPAELIKAGDRTINSEIHQLISVWNKEKLLEEQKELIIVPMYKKGEKTDCRLLAAVYQILSSILPSRLNPYAEEIIGYYQCGF